MNCFRAENLWSETLNYYTDIFRFLKHSLNYAFKKILRGDIFDDNILILF